MNTTTISTFDPIAFKSTTRAQWEDAAESWHRWGPAIENWLGAATEQMLDDARLGPGSRVLDIAAGAGGQTLAAAHRVGATGHVLATDISPTILEYAASAVAEAGFADVVATLEADGEDLAAVTDRQLRRRDLPSRPDLLPRSAAGALGDLPGGAPWRPDRLGRLLHPGPQRVLRDPGQHHPPDR